MPKSDRWLFFDCIKQGSTVYLEKYLKNYKKYNITLQQMVDYGPKENGNFGRLGEPLEKALYWDKPKIFKMLIEKGAHVYYKKNNEYFNALKYVFSYNRRYLYESDPTNVQIIIEKMGPLSEGFNEILTIEYDKDEGNQSLGCKHLWRKGKRSLLDWCIKYACLAKMGVEDYYWKGWKKAEDTMKKYGALTTDEIMDRHKRARTRKDLGEMIAYGERKKESEERIITLKKQLIDQEINELEIEKNRLNGLKCNNILFSNDKGCDTKKEHIEKVEKQITQKKEEKAALEQKQQADVQNKQEKTSYQEMKSLYLKF